jgi:hypothetical protein
VKTLTVAVFIELFSYIYAAGLSPREIVSQSIANYEEDWKAALNFTYIEQDVTKDSSGDVKSSETSQVTVIDGTPYNRLIARNGRPLNTEETQKENEKYLKAVSARDEETPEQRGRRIGKYESERRFLREIPNAFKMTMLGRETVNGRENYVIGLTPDKDYIPKSRSAHMFREIEGKLWVDERDLRWTKAEANVIGGISIGWVLARVGPGARIEMTQEKVEGDHWMPKAIDIRGSVRIMLVRTRSLDETISYSEYTPIKKRISAVASRSNSPDQ